MSEDGLRPGAEVAAEAVQRLLGSIPAPEAWASLPRQRREVVPYGADTTAVDRFLADTGLLNGARVLTVYCPKGHRLAVVLMVEREHVYIANADSRVGDVFVHDRDGRRIEAPKADHGRRRVQYIEFLDRTEPEGLDDDEVPEPVRLALLATYRLPARCAKCDGASPGIPAMWLAAKLSNAERAGALPADKWVTWPDAVAPYRA